MRLLGVWSVVVVCCQCRCHGQCIPPPLNLVAPAPFLLLTVPSNVLGEAIFPHGDVRSKCRMYSTPRLWTRAAAVPLFGNAVVAVPTCKSVCHFPLSISSFPPPLPLLSHRIFAFLTSFPLPIFLSCHCNCYRHHCHHRPRKKCLSQCLIGNLFLILAYSWLSPSIAVACRHLHGSQRHCLPLSLLVDCCLTANATVVCCLPPPCHWR
jgi:hypothetical protein